MKNVKMVVFAPHPDDETMGCGGTIAKKTRDGYDVLIVVMTDGRNAFRSVLGIDSEPTPFELKEIRKGELERAMRILGVPKENIVFLNFEDGTLGNSEKKAEDVVTEIMARNRPEEAYFPYKNDCNPDHRATYRIAKNSIRKLDGAKLIYQYSIAQKYSRIGPVLNGLSNLWKHDLVHVDISGFLDIKRMALEEYKSQFTIISSRQKRPVMEDYQRFLKKKEVFFIDE